MMQFLNNIWVALTSDNPELLNILLFFAGIVENYLFMNLFLSIFNVPASKKSKILYVLIIVAISFITTKFVTAPFNIILNYACIYILMRLIFKLDFLKGFISLLISSFIFALLNTLLQNPYLTILNITLDVFMTIPIYRISYLIIVYFLLFVFCILFKKFNNIKLNLELLNSLHNIDKKTLKIIYLNAFIGFVTLCIQLITTTFYIDIVPIIISIFNFILLISFLSLSIYSLTRMLELSATRMELQSAEEYNKSLQFLYDKVKGYKHDFDNTVSTMDGFIENNDIEGLKKYFEEVKEDCQMTNNVSLLNPHLINNPGIYSLLNCKYFKATEAGIKFDIEFFLDLNKLDVNMYKFSRILGVLIDNAIEEAEKCDEKIVKVSFLRENRNSRAVITVKNTYSNKDVDTEKIFEKGVSGKENHSGIGLWEVKKYVKKSKNLDLFTSKTNKYFKQELYIYDL